MATPTYKDMLEGRTVWMHSHKGVSVKISHHGYRKDGGFTESPGTWCYYVLLSQKNAPDDWARFRAKKGKFNFGPVTRYSESEGPAWGHDWFHGGITSTTSGQFTCRKTGLRIKTVEVGCDYAHLWDSEAGFPDTLETVKSDAEQTVDSLLAANPHLLVRNKWSGEFGPLHSWESKKEETV